MTSNVIHVDLEDLVKMDVGELADRMLDASYEVIMEAAHLIVGLAQVNVRVKTGSLRDSIRVERGGQGKYWRQVRVRAGGYITNPDTGKLVNYAAIVESKYPYMRPAYEDVKPQVNMAIQAGVIKEVG